MRVIMERMRQPWVEVLALSTGMLGLCARRRSGHRTHPQYHDSHQAAACTLPQIEGAPMRTRVLFLVTGAFLGASASAAAQSHATDRGVWLLDGNASLVHNSTSGSSSGSTGLRISGAAGYFLIPGVAVSANLQFAHSTSSGSSSTLYGVGPGLLLWSRGPQGASFSGSQCALRASDPV